MVLLLLLLGCGRDGSFRPPDGTRELRVMTFNVWAGGVQVNPASVVQAVRAAGADVVGLQETEGSTRPIARALGWTYADERLQVISRYPLIDPPGGDGTYLLVEPQPGRVIALANVHLTSDPYGPDAVRDGASPDSVLSLERATRLPEVRLLLEALPKLVAAGVPVILTGDFNAPSHRDWTAATAQARKQVKFPLRWPVSEALEQAGLRDSYREVHPDPVQRFGLTWTPGYPPPTLGPNETFDRIDMVYAAGPVRTVASQIVGEPGGPDVDIAVAPWPSDHRAVVSTFRMTPATPPVLVAVSRRLVTAGEPIVVRYHAPGQGEQVAILRAGAGLANPAVMSRTTGESPIDGAAVFGTATLVPGDYEAALVSRGGTILARQPFAVMAQGGGPELRVDRRGYASGESIVVRWRNAPGNRWDWVGIYPAGETDLEHFLTWQHTEAAIAGMATFDPLPPGAYEVRLLADDSYILLASARFTVTGQR